MSKHKTRPVKLWVDVDEDIVDLVVYLGDIPGVRTHSSCQGSVDKPPYVIVSWSSPEAEARLRREFDFERMTGSFAHVYPKGSLKPEMRLESILGTI